jgi:hypothetical protein
MQYQLSPQIKVNALYYTVVVLDIATAPPACYCITADMHCSVYSVLCCVHNGTRTHIDRPHEQHNSGLSHSAVAVRVLASDHVFAVDAFRLSYLAVVYLLT